MPPEKTIERSGTITWGFPTGMTLKSGAQVIKAHRVRMPAYISAQGVTVFVFEGKNQSVLHPDEREPDPPDWSGTRVIEFMGFSLGKSE